MIEIHLSPKEVELLQNFAKIAQKDEHGDYCVPLYTSTGELTLFSSDTRKYQRFGYRRIMGLIHKNVLFIEIKKVKKERKFICIHGDLFEEIKSQLPR